MRLEDTHIPDLQAKLEALFDSGRNPSITTLKALGYAVGYGGSNPAAGVSKWWERGSIPSDKLVKLCHHFRIEADWLRLEPIDAFVAKLAESRGSGGSLWARMTAAVAHSAGTLMLSFREADAVRGHPRIGKATAPALPEVQAEEDFAIELTGASAYRGWKATILTHDGASFSSLCPSQDFATVPVSDDGTLLFPPMPSSEEPLWLNYAISDVGQHWLFVVLARQDWPTDLVANLVRSDLAPHEVAGVLEDLAAECQARPKEDWVLIKQAFRVMPRVSLGFVAP